MTRSIASSSSDILISRLVAPRRQESRLVDQVGEIGAGEPGGLAGQHLQVDAFGERLALGVHVENLLPALQVGTVDDDLSVEPAGTQQRRVEDVGPVGRRDHDHAGLHVEAVELDEQLIEGLLPLVVPAAETGATVASNGVDLVDEDDRRGVLLWPVRRGRAPGWPRPPRTSRRSPIPRSRRTARRPRRQRPGPAASFRSRGGRRGARPWGSWPPWPGTSAGTARNSLISSSSSTASSQPATSSNVTLGWSFCTCLACDLPNCITRLPPPWSCKRMKMKRPKSSRYGKTVVRNHSSRVGFWLSTITSTPAASMATVSSSSVSPG